MTEPQVLLRMDEETMKRDHPIYGVDESVAGSLAKAVKPAYPDNNPKTQFGLKKVPMDLCPPALTRGAAEAFANGAEKYGAYNWRENMISSSVYYAACKRHLDDWWDRIDEKDLAPDSLVHHLKHAAACIGMILDTMDSDLLNDNRPRKVVRK